jgi:hypothetical protein
VRPTEVRAGVVLRESYGRSDERGWSENDGELVVGRAVSPAAGQGGRTTCGFHDTDLRQRLHGTGVGRNLHESMVGVCKKQFGLYGRISLLPVSSPRRSQALAGECILPGRTLIVWLCTS